MIVPFNEQLLRAPVSTPGGGMRALVSHAASAPAVSFPTAPKHDDVLACGEMLGGLVQIGLPLEHVPKMEHAFWNILRSKEPDPLDEVSPFKNGSTTVDIETITRRVNLDGIPARERDLLHDELFTLLHAVDHWQSDHMPLPGDSIGERLGPRSRLRLGLLVRLAAFAALARVFGVHEWKLPQLRNLTLTAAGL